MLDLVTSREQSRSASLTSAVESLSSGAIDRLYEKYGAASVDVVIDAHRSQFPRLDRTSLPARVDQVVAAMLNLAGDDDGRTYEKGPTHDKEPYDKDRGYDKEGFSRT